MRTGLRRIRVTALRGALVGLGVVAVLFGRRPEARAATGAVADAEVPSPLPSPLPSTAVAPALPSTPPPASRMAYPGRGAIAAGLVGLLLLAGMAAGILLGDAGLPASRGPLLGPESPATGGTPLAALSSPDPSPDPVPSPRADATTAVPSPPDRPPQERPPEDRPPQEAPAKAGAALSDPPESRAPSGAEDADRAADRPTPPGTSETGAAAGSRAGGEMPSEAPAESSNPPGGPRLADGSGPEAGRPSVPGKGRDDAADRTAPREPPDDPRQPASTGSLAARIPADSGSAVSGAASVFIVRGDSLWSISRRRYGRGGRYTLIHEANRDRVRDPDLIYPGQILVLPPRDRRGDGRRTVSSVSGRSPIRSGSSTAGR